jgi:hypothetical protein
MISEEQPADIRRPFAERPRPLVFPAIDALTRISGGAADAVDSVKIEIGPLTTAWQIWPNAAALVWGPQNRSNTGKSPRLCRRVGGFYWHQLQPSSSLTASRTRRVTRRRSSTFLVRSTE